MSGLPGRGRTGFERDALGQLEATAEESAMLRNLAFGTTLRTQPGGGHQRPVGIGLDEGAFEEQPQRKGDSIPRTPSPVYNYADKQNQLFHGNVGSIPEDDSGAPSRRNPPREAPPRQGRDAGLA